MFFLFSSTGRDQYIQDVINIMSLPHSSIYHFRYNMAWVDDDINSNLSIFKGPDKRGLIVFVKQETTSSFSTSVFYPLRQVEITEVEQKGTILHVYFKVGQFVNWGKQASSFFDSKLKAFLSIKEKMPDKKYFSVINSDSTSNDPTKNIDKFITYTNLNSDDTSAWEEIIDAIIVEKVFENTIFYRIEGVRKTNRDFVTGKIKPEVSRIELEQILPHQNGFRLKRKEIYGLNLLFYQNRDIKAPLKGTKITITTDKSLFAFTQNPIEINFKYDQQTIYLAPINSFQEQFTQLVLDFEKPSQKEDNIPLSSITNDPVGNTPPISPVIPEPIRAPKINLTLKLSYNGWFYLIAFVGLLLAQFIATAPKVILGFFPQNSVPEDVLKALGSIFSAFIIFWVFRELPKAPK